MALTATAQSAFPSRWEDEIVPTLRKRLQDESRMLTKRMSATSTSDDGSFPSAYFYNEPSTASGLSQRTAASSKPSAIPRPSTSTRPVDLQTEVPLKPPVSKRPRTYSQPFLYDTTANGVQPTMPASSSPRAESPSTSRIQDVRPTRIPVPRGRSPSFSSSTIIQPNGAAHKNGLTANGPTTDSLITNGITTNGPIANGHHLALVSTALYGHEPSPPSPDTPPVLQHQHSAILRERAPFGTVTAPTATSHGHYAPPPRASRDSDEGQFEHWYRGDTSRNGGVGELRVGRRTEMLEIASYGHTFAVPPASRAGSRLDAPARDTLPGRRRAGSVGARRSFYMEDDADARAHGRVLDEAPLTDVDMSGDDVGRGASSDSGGEDDPADTTYTYSYTNHAPQPAADLSAASLSPTAYSPNTSYNGRGTPSPSPHPTAKKNAPVQESRQKPAVAAQPKMSPPLTRGITEPIPARANATSPQQPRSVASRQPQTLSPGSRGHAKSPAGKGGPTSTKKASKTVTPSRRRVEARRSIGEYPAPADGEGEGDDSLADAIPTWSEPRARGDWDEVVLPAVARKKGLDKEYDAADGSPKPKRVGETVYEPAPGTFGFDHSRYKPPQEYDHGEIPMNEFGQSEPPQLPAADDRPEDDSMHDDGAPEPEPEPPRAEPAPPQPLPQPAVSKAQRPMSPPRMPSPLPFSSYAQPPKEESWPSQNAQPTYEQRPPSPEDEPKAGCCSRCVIM